jgi:hypothetical protein
LSDHELNVESSLEQAVERSHRERRRAAEDEIEGGGHLVIW